MSLLFTACRCKKNEEQKFLLKKERTQTESTNGSQGNNIYIFQKKIGAKILGVDNIEHYHRATSQLKKIMFLGYTKMIYFRVVRGENQYLVEGSVH